MKTRTFVLDWTDGHWTIDGLMFDPARIDADPRLGTTEIWEFENRSDQSHDGHLHLVQFQSLGRVGQPPAPYRRGWKDTQRWCSEGAMGPMNGNSHNSWGEIRRTTFLRFL